MKTLLLKWSLFLASLFFGINLLEAQQTDLTITNQLKVTNVTNSGLDLRANGILFGQGSGNIDPSTLPHGNFLLWNPANGSIRAGAGNLSVGTQSAAFGSYLSATGANSFATGYSSSSSGYASTATGYLATATGSVSFATGYFPQPPAWQASRKGITLLPAVTIPMRKIFIPSPLAMPRPL